VRIKVERHSMATPTNSLMQLQLNSNQKTIACRFITHGLVISYTIPTKQQTVHWTNDNNNNGNKQMNYDH